MSEESNEVVIGSEEVLHQRGDHSIRKTFSTLKEENDKLRTYLGLVKMCNNSAINKIKSAINETIGSIHSANESTDCTIDSNVILKQLSVIQSEIMNMQSMHTKLDEGIEAFQLIDNIGANSHSSDETNDHNRDNFVVVTTRYDVPRKTTGIRKAVTNKSSAKSKSKATKETAINTKLLNRIVDIKQLKGMTTFVDSPQTTQVCSEEREAVASIDGLSSGECRENVSEVSDLNITETVPNKVTKRPYISEEFKLSHLQRLVEAKRRREEMSRQEGKRKAKPKRFEDRLREMAEMDKKSPKKRATKKKTVGKVTKKKLAVAQPMAAQSIVVPISQSTLDSLSGQTIQIIASGGTQILCRNDGTFIPATNSTQWSTTNAQWTTTDNNFTQSQWSQYQT